MSAPSFQPFPDCGPGAIERSACASRQLGLPRYSYSCLRAAAHSLPRLSSGQWMSV